MHNGGGDPVDEHRLWIFILTTTVNTKYSYMLMINSFIQGFIHCFFVNFLQKYYSEKDTATESIKRLKRQRGNY